MKKECGKRDSIKKGQFEYNCPCCLTLFILFISLYLAQYRRLENWYLQALSP
jgi:hypothetical protein